MRVLCGVSLRQGSEPLKPGLTDFFCLFEAAKKALSVEIPNENVIYEMCLYTCELKGENNATCDIVVF